MESMPGVGVGVMILRDNKVLLGKRLSSSLLNQEGTWTMPGGKMRTGESFEDVAYRETLEETGMKINKEKLNVISLTNDIAGKHFITIVFLCEDFEGEPKVIEPDEVTDWRWFALNELPDNIYMPSKKALKNFKDKVFYKY